MLRNLVTLALLAATTALSLDATTAAVIVHPRVHRTLAAQGTVNLIVTMKESPSRVLREHTDNFDHAEFHRRLAIAAERMPANATSKWDILRRGVKIKQLVDALKQHANETQQVVASLVAAQNVTAAQPLFTKQRQFWMTNQVFFRNASAELVATLSATPGVLEVREEKRYPLPKITIMMVGNVTADAAATGDDRSLQASADEASGVTTAPPSSASVGDIARAQWGVKKTGATTAWAAGNTGQGITVGLIDTGVLATHETINSNFRGAANYGWFDPEKKASVPYDPQGHGTAVTSLAVGRKGYGVAPGATWMLCKSCRDDDCPESDTLACLQWMLCPTDTNGEHADCSKAPHIVNNSWGSDTVDWTMQTATKAWVAAGILPIFANGNAGPLCNTVAYPAGYPEVLSVGASRSDDAVISSSSKGPSSDGSIKPDLIAPGYSVKSAYGDADASYVTSEGTSLAAPHVAGAVALMLSANVNLTMAEIRTALTRTTVRKIAATQRTCGGTVDATIPNNQFGFGRVDITAALTATATKVKK